MMDEFTCAICKETFEKERTDEEANQEYKILFGSMKKAEDPICDDCFAYLTFYYGWPVIPLTEE